MSTSEFERQVREALRDIVAQAHGPTFHGASFDALAQRVAAMAEMAARTGWDNGWAVDVREAIPRALNASLAALRGGAALGEREKPTHE